MTEFCTGRSNTMWRVTVDDKHVRCQTENMPQFAVNGQD